MKQRDEARNAHAKAVAQAANLTGAVQALTEERDDALTKAEAAEAARPVQHIGEQHNYYLETPDAGSAALRNRRQRLLSSENRPVPAPPTPNPPKGPEQPPKPQVPEKPADHGGSGTDSANPKP